MIFKHFILIIKCYLVTSTKMNKSCNKYIAHCFCSMHELMGPYFKVLLNKFKTLQLP